MALYGLKFWFLFFGVCSSCLEVVGNPKVIIASQVSLMQRLLQVTLRFQKFWFPNSIIILHFFFKTCLNLIPDSLQQRISPIIFFPITIVAYLLFHPYQQLYLILRLIGVKIFTLSLLLKLSQWAHCFITVFVNCPFLEVVIDVFLYYRASFKFRVHDIYCVVFIGRLRLVFRGFQVAWLVGQVEMLYGFL